MGKELQKVLKEANRELKERFFMNYEIMIDGDFKSEYNFIVLTKESHNFSIATVETEGEAVAAIKGYMTGLAHGNEKSYVRFCDKD